MFTTAKDDGLIPYVLTQILDACVNGITLSDPDLPDNPIVYANKVFEEMSGYSQEEVVGRNCRFLQGEDRDQEALATIRKALAKREGCVVTLRNYRKNGELFINRLSIRPLLDREGVVIYYLGVQYDISDQPGERNGLDQLGFS
ncbi:PAS domain-containing protein [Accumulibacter sp.]|uniref:PAS domain-containing protein n=1 Tax=Accumulibacter sp. TaxID=2053492 RepID=UPI001D7DF860|nr:PAS domain-containing protein [Accumulibacter sp.]MCB1966337.1 PAS domain-containing protein [Accumulibacter sp.]MCP5227070.1 PAS domain-containing protein [Accumulibacter sp.]